MALPHSTEKIIGWRTQYAAMLRWHKRCELCHDGRSNWLTGENCLLAKTSRPGNVVTATRIDRLAGSAFAPFGIVKRIVDAKAQFRSLAEPWADTGTSTGRLMLAVLGGLADVERDLIRTRTAEGRSRAKAQGKHMAVPLPSRRHNRKRPPDGARRARCCRNWRTATKSAEPRFLG